MKLCIPAPVRLTIADGERTFSYEYDMAGFNISFPWASIPNQYRRELISRVTDELMRQARVFYEEIVGEVSYHRPPDDQDRPKAHRE